MAEPTPTPLTTEAKVTDLSLALRNPGFSHAGNILVALRRHEFLGTPHDDMVTALHDEFIQRHDTVSTNTPKENA